MTKCRLLLLVSFAWLLDSGASLRAQDREIAILERADTTLTELMTMPLNWVPVHRFMMDQVRKLRESRFSPVCSRRLRGSAGDMAAASS